MSRRIVLMGVAGSGKSAVGAELAARLGAIYLDGDDLHPAENIAKMSRGEPLSDEDRWPWLTLVGQKLLDPDGILILGCSALKRRYRNHIRAEAEAPVTFVHLSGSKERISQRVLINESPYSGTRPQIICLCNAPRLPGRSARDLRSKHQWRSI